MKVSTSEEIAMEAIEAIEAIGSIGALEVLLFGSILASVMMATIESLDVVLLSASMLASASTLADGGSDRDSNSIQWSTE